MTVDIQAIAEAGQYGFASGFHCPDLFSTQQFFKWLEMIQTKEDLFGFFVFNGCGNFISCTAYFWAFWHYVL
jgi:hypothetical protein